MNDNDELLPVLLAQEQRLVFSRFDLDTAWELGCQLRDEALAAQLPVAISIRRGGQCLFHAALAGSSADNDGWLLRKARVVERYPQVKSVVDRPWPQGMNHHVIRMEAQQQIGINDIIEDFLALVLGQAG